jgi:multimeric flavodoxin WrbA
LERLKVVAVSGSLVAGGNVDALLDHALEEYSGDDRFEVTRFSLSGMEVGHCLHCNWCLKNQVEGRYCARRDDMSRVYPELMGAAGVIVASPVHIGRLSGATADFLDRLRVFVHGNITRGAMRNKVGGALAVAWFRNAGIEMTLVSIDTAFTVLGMVVASPDLGVWGAAAFSSLQGSGLIREGDRLLVKQDELGMASARSLACRVGELAMLLEAGRRAEEL